MAIEEHTAPATGADTVNNDQAQDARHLKSTGGLFVAADALSHASDFGMALERLLDDLSVSADDMEIKLRLLGLQAIAKQVVGLIDVANDALANIERAAA